jgi:hypothetical protein
MNIPKLSITDTNPPIPALAVTENPSPSHEFARPPNISSKEYIAVQDDINEGAWLLGMMENGELRHLTKDEAGQVASIMNEQGSNIITLFCRNDACKDKGTFIQRASQDAKKNVYHCVTCMKGMTK